MHTSSIINNFFINNVTTLRLKDIITVEVHVETKTKFETQTSLK